MGSVGIPNKGKDVRYQVMDVRTLETKNVAIVWRRGLVYKDDLVPTKIKPLNSKSQAMGQRT